MKEHETKEDILANAVEQLKGRAESSAPPAEVVRETLSKLGQAGPSRVGAVRNEGHIRLLVWPVAKLAVAAAIFITAGYVFGRASAPKPPDMEQLRAALLPDLLAVAAQERQQAIAAAYIQLKDNLTEQYRADLNRSAIQTFTASNTVTNQLLEELVQAVKVSRLQDRQWVADALEEIESQRIQDSTELGAAIAVTDSQLQRTREDIVKLLVYRQLDVPNPADEKLNHPN